MLPLEMMREYLTGMLGGSAAGSKCPPPSLPQGARLAALGGSSLPGEEAGPLGAPPLPRAPEPAASKAA